MRRLDQNRPASGPPALALLLLLAGAACGPHSPADGRARRRRASRARRGGRRGPSTSRARRAAGREARVDRDRHRRGAPAPVEPPARDHRRGRLRAGPVAHVSPRIPGRVVRVPAGLGRRGRRGPHPGGHRLRRARRSQGPLPRGAQPRERDTESYSGSCRSTRTGSARNGRCWTPSPTSSRRGPSGRARRRRCASTGCPPAIRSLESGDPGRVDPSRPRADRRAGRREARHRRRAGEPRGTCSRSPISATSGSGSTSSRGTWRGSTKATASRSGSMPFPTGSSPAR